MSATVPVDQDARTLIAEALTETVFAVAGAGSGKTLHLVERVCAVLLTGTARIEAIAVITFTEAAAAELRDRIADDLEKAAAGADPARARRAADALGGLDGAAITTLHGFARRILAAYPFDAGLPPAFEVLDEARSLADLDEHWGDTVDALLAHPASARAVRWAMVAGADLAKLRSIARLMGEQWDRVVPQGAQGPISTALPDLDPGPVLRPLRNACSLAAACSDPADLLLGHLDRLAPYAAHLEGAGDDELRLLRLLVQGPKLAAGRRGTRDAWGGRKDEVTALLEEAETARDRLARRAVDAALRVVGAALGGLVVAAARRRQREGRLQYHDLLVLACDLVRTHPDVRCALHGQYSYLFVDEFQDTDPLQAELVTMIAAEPRAPVGSVPWWELETRRGALFFVGDPLQSIYAFRRADVATFLKTLDEVATQTAPLVTNFRSVPGIVEWVNAVFASLVGDGTPSIQPRYSPLVPARQATGDAPPAVTVIGAGVGPIGHAHDARRREAAELVAVLHTAVGEGWHVGAGNRCVQWDDIAILVPSRTWVPALEAALAEAGIDYRLESSSLVYGAPEVQDLLHALRAIDDPSDHASVVAALRSPGLGCGDDDLLAYRLAGGSWDYRADPPATVAPDDPVRCGLARLRALHDERMWTGVSELVAHVVDELRQFAAALDGPRWREEWRRLRFVLDQARLYAETSPGTLRQYLAWVEVQRDEDAKVTEVVLPEADAPAVAIMTVHAAKGLQFPVVAVVGLGAAPQGVRGPTVLFVDDGMELAINKDACTDGYEAARAAATELQSHERLRLFYVGVTRAQNHLVASVHRAAGVRASVAERLEEALGEAGALPGAPASTGTSERTLPAAPGTVHLLTAGDLEGDSPDALAHWATARARRFGTRPKVVAATGVAKVVAEPAPLGVPGPRGAPGDGEFDDAADLDDVAPDAVGARALWRRGRAGTALGRAVHAVLQTVDLRTGDRLDAMARAHATAEGVPGRWQEVARLARAALDSEIVRTAVAGRHWRELYVGAPIGAGILEGFVDLLFDGPDGLEVVDYKTDQVRADDDLDRLVEHYRLQGAAYAAAVEAATGRRVVRCTLLFLRDGVAVARRLVDLADATATVRSAVADLGRMGS